MSVLGRWKLKGINMPTETGKVCYTEGNLPEDVAEVFEENKDMILEFLEDGTLNTIVPATGAYLEMAKEEGITPREDGFIVAYSAQWEDRNGTIYYDSGAEGTIMDEAVDPFVPIEFTDEGDLLFHFGMLLYERL